ncbi:AAA family ATPase [Tenacibaculum finnmarkense]|uniref:DEAD/DEAH box helicase n=1 Tax=Tenacibaculum finnmarkense TaxID=2781243 RepID=UPI001EFB8908|nr:AAA domain-containing protein [Tenacibaculum finnmarkense]MCG8812565.1 AAA family ATPase [Tenacibaculum finnmarkense]
MEKINSYEIIEEIKSYEKNIILWLVKDNSGKEFEILTIKKIAEFENKINRIFKNEINPLKNTKIKGVQQVLETEFDKINNVYFIVYENSQDNFYQINNFNKKNFLELVEILNSLNKRNQYGFVLNNETILINEQNNILIKYIGLFEIFKEYKILNNTFLSSEILDNKKPKIQDDIFAIATLFKEYLLDKPTDILPKSLAIERKDRYKKYSELLEDIEKIEESNIYLSNNRDSIRVVSNVSNNDFSPILQEMNEECYWTIEDKRNKKGNITGRFTTKNYSERYFLDTDNYIFIRYSEHINKPNDDIKRDGSIAQFNFTFDNSRFNCIQYFKKEFEQKNKLASLNKTKTAVLTKWQTLPEKEKEFIEEKAFKATYFEREESKNNNQNIKFKLTEEFKDWGNITELKKKKTVLSIDDTDIGEILDFNPSDNFIIIKEAKLTLEEIPEEGELIEDVRRETSQFKKQAEACKQFSERNIVNPEIAGILATPEKIPPFNRVDLDYDEFEKEIISDKLKNDESQKDAVLEALHKKPVFLIQGPPGAGKTTVIVELVQQLIKKNPNCKILISSQANLAVDNVLERLPKEILFMRLASEQVLENNNIKSNIIEHLFDEKLKHWIEKTAKNSTKYLENKFGSKSKNKVLIDFFSDYNIIKKNNQNNEKKLLREFHNKLRFSPNYIKKIFENINSKKEIEKIFSKELGEKYQKLIELQKDWFAFINNATSKEKSFLNNGSTEIDLQSAYAKSMNVFGATCIHIASSKYKNIDFKFDYVIMDEASKASPAETLVPINMAKNIVLIGDHKQLPPVITRETAIKDKVKEELGDNGLDFEKEYGESLFESLITSFEVNPSLKPYMKMLDIQYRMPRHLGNIISKNFYDDDNQYLKNPNIELEILKDYDADRFHELKLKKPFVEIYDKFSNSKIEVPNSVLFISTSKEEKPNDNGDKFERKNQCNVDKIKEILTELNKLYKNNTEKEKPFEIGIIAGYRGQVELLKNKIKFSDYPNFNIQNEDKSKSLIEINTVDKFQGAERDIIIYDIVRSDKENTKIGFLQDYRRINVAFSRAKCLLIIVGDSEYILKRATIHKDEKFTDFKLKNIVKELEEQKLIFNYLKNAIND